jgi:hypothetical protein
MLFGLIFLTAEQLPQSQLVMSKTREFSVSGTTAPLVDGLTRNVTLVAIITTEEVTETRTNRFTKTHGRVTTTTIVDERVTVATNTTVRFGMAVVSPVDVPVQTPERGVEIARGKAMKPKAALATINTGDKFFTTHMVKTMLAEKLAHIQADPNQFIRVTAPKPVVVKEAAKNIVSESVLQNA